MFTHTAEFPVAAAGTRITNERRAWNALPVLFAGVAMLCALRAASLLINPAPREREFTIPEGVVTDFGRRLSHSHRYRAEVTAAAVRVGEPQRWVIHLEQRNGRRVAHAKLQTRVWMPETGLESAIRPTATYIGNGEYRLDDVRFTRPGWWNVALVVNAAAGIDSLAFNVDVSLVAAQPRHSAAESREVKQHLLKSVHR